MSAGAGSPNPSDRRAVITQAITLLVSKLTENSNLLTVSESGLMTHEKGCGFRRLPEHTPLPRGPIYVGIRTPPFAEIRSDITDACFHNVNQALDTLSARLKKLSRTRKKILMSRFDSIKEGTTLYINVQPIIEAETSELAREALSIEARREVLGNISETVLSVILGGDGTRNMLTPSGSKLMGTVELAATAALQRGNIRKIRLNSPQAQRYLGTDPAECEQHWQNFLQNMNAQIGEREEPQR